MVKIGVGVSAVATRRLPIALSPLMNLRCSQIVAMRTSHMKSNGIPMIMPSSARGITISAKSSVKYARLLASEEELVIGGAYKQIAIFPNCTAANCRVSKGL
jgi:hypothetical protein